MEPKPEYSLEEQGPFERAQVRVYGRTADEALERARILRGAVVVTLSKESTCYPPTYRGFNPEHRRHYAVFVVALGGDRDKERQTLDQFAGHVSSDK